MADKRVISELTTLATVDKNADWLPVVDVSDTSASTYGTTKKALVEQFIGPQGETGAPGTNGINGTNGVDGDDAYCYIAYASDASGTGFTTTFDESLNYIAIKSTDTAIVSPVASDFTGLWKNYKGATGAQGTQGIQGNAGTNGTDGDDAYVYIAYASDASGTGFTMTFDALLDYIAVKNTTTTIASPVASDFAGLWKNYKGATGATGPAGAGSGDVLGPATNNADYLPQWNGADSKTLKNGLAVTTTVANPGVDTNIPTEKAVRTAINGFTSYTDEQAQDAAGTILTDSTEIDFTYTDETPSITASIKSGSIDETKLDTSTNASLDLADSSIQKTTNITSLNETGIADGEVAVFNLTNKDIRTSNVLISTDGTLGGNSDTDIPTEKAVKTYVDGTKFTWKGAWATSTPYSLNDTVENNGSGYICTSAHTSGTFATDLAAGKWSLFVEGYTSSGIVDLIYPVGAIYISVVSTSPATLFGGTWSAFGAGKTLVGISAGETEFDTVEETGGVKTVTLTAAQSGLPSHNHNVFPLNTGSGAGYAQVKTGTNASSPMTQDTSVYLGGTTSNTATDASEAHTNLQPYIVTYMWKRTA